MWKRFGVPLAAAGLGIAAVATASGASPPHRPGGVSSLHPSAAVVRPEQARRPASSESRPRWVPYHQEDFGYAAGEACSFGVKAHVVRDREYSKAVALDTDGTVITELFKGPLVIRYTNLRSGKHIRVNQSGRAIETFDGDGEFVSLLVQTGHFGTALTVGSDLPKGLYRIGGRWSSLSISDDATRTVALGPWGRAQNLCVRLS